MSSRAFHARCWRARSPRSRGFGKFGVDCLRPSFRNRSAGRAHRYFNAAWQTIRSSWVTPSHPELRVLIVWVRALYRACHGCLAKKTSSSPRIFQSESG